MDNDRYKISYINLAQPQLSQAYAPAEIKKMKYGDLEFTLWDRIELTGEMTLKKFLEYFRTEYKLEVTGLMQGNIMLYVQWMSPARLRERMNMKLSRIVERISRKRIPSTFRSLWFEITCVTFEGEDIENLPKVYYTLPLKPSNETTAPNPEEQ